MRSKSCRSTRSSSNLDFIVPRIKTCESEAFFYQAVKNWNDLPRDIKECKNREAFKKNVKEHLMKKGLDRFNCDFHFYWIRYWDFKCTFNCLFRFNVLLIYVKSANKIFNMKLCDSQFWQKLWFSSAKVFARQIIFSFFFHIICFVFKVFNMKYS